MEILYEDRHITVCIKEPGISSEDRPGADTVPARLRARWGRPDAYVGVVHRLDTATGGVMVYARTKAAAAALSAQVAAGGMVKEYRCVCAGAPAPAAGEMQDWLFKDSRKNKVFPVKGPRKGAKAARLAYRVLAEGPMPGRTGQSEAEKAAPGAAISAATGSGANGPRGTEKAAAGEQAGTVPAPAAPGRPEGATVAQAEKAAPGLAISVALSSGAARPRGTEKSAAARVALLSDSGNAANEELATFASAGPTVAAPIPAAAQAEQAAPGAAISAATGSRANGPRGTEHAAAGEQAGTAALCAVRLYTGRTHQIRVQFASRRHPLLGDGKYGSRVKGPLALWCCRLTFTPPGAAAPRTFTAPPPASGFFAAFGPDVYDL